MKIPTAWIINIGSIANLYTYNSSVYTYNSPTQTYSGIVPGKPFSTIKLPTVWTNV